MILDMSSGDFRTPPVRVDNVRSLVVRDGNGTPVAAFKQWNDESMTYVAAGDPKFKTELAAMGFLERVDVLRTSL